MPRRLLNIASVVCLVACVALMGMWVRSYFRHDAVSIHLSGFTVLEIDQFQGNLRVSRYVDHTPLAPNYTSTTDEEWWSKYRGKEEFPNHSLGFGFRFTYFGGRLFLPHWFLVLACGSLAMICRLRWSPRFSLRTLLIQRLVLPTQIVPRPEMWTYLRSIRPAGAR
jgi:hypothetical protein